MARPISQRGNVAAAGYTQYANALIQPKFADSIIGQVYCDSIAPAITTGDYTRGLASCGNSIGFLVEPAIQVREHQKNQKLVPQEIEGDWRWLNIDRQKYFMVKIDRVDQKQSCQLSKLVSRFRLNAGRQMAKLLDPEVLSRMVCMASSQTKGRKAGPAGMIDLGGPGAPIVLTATNIVEVLIRLTSVLRQMCRWEMGRMVVVLPEVLRGIILSNPILTNALIMGTGQSMLVKGDADRELLGFDVMFSNYTPMVTDPATGQAAWWIIAAHEKATGFIQQIDDYDIVSGESFFGKFYRGLWVYGHGVMVPEAVAVAYVTVQ